MQVLLNLYLQSFINMFINAKSRSPRTFKHQQLNNKKTQAKTSGYLPALYQQPSTTKKPAKKFVFVGNYCVIRHTQISHPDFPKFSQKSYLGLKAFHHFVWPVFPWKKLDSECPEPRLNSESLGTVCQSYATGKWNGN